ncbi:hypothetical protein [Planktothricoides raciborskii]|uniref:Uncharacterized protein n=1 Tax=Planktothricoides raciborskii FACHB-1370 TaxID=2949576 RepID=A0ABR8EDH5_9CYAN|nr:hypothetical protein [Planktothricoides raciborskii]MBD2544856.1 hypothetical protein [Planktothricoides raciborskii FACHB-1370]MBD2583048.1 hypothetical protein [Planktothricoides raciborskii FACHB-1261]
MIIFYTAVQACVQVYHSYAIAYLTILVIGLTLARQIKHHLLWWACSEGHPTRGVVATSAVGCCSLYENLVSQSLSRLSGA